MFNLPVNNNISVTPVYNNARIIRGLIQKGFSASEIHTETGFPMSSIEIMIDEYASKRDNNKEGVI